MSDEEFNFTFDRKFLTNQPYFDINNSIEEYMLDFGSLCEDNFSQFINEFIKKYSKMRKFFITRDLPAFRKEAHAIKNVFM